MQKLVYLMVLMSYVISAQIAFAQERYNYLSVNGELLDDLGPFYFVKQGNSTDSYVRLDSFAKQLGLEYSYDGKTLNVLSPYRTIVLEATNNISLGMQKRPNVLSVNGEFIESPMGIVVNNIPYAAINTITKAIGGEIGWRGEEQLIWVHYDPNKDVSKAETPGAETPGPDTADTSAPAKANAPPTSTETRGATLGTPRIGAQESGQTRVAIDLPANTYYEVYAFDKTFIVSLPQLGASAFDQDFAADPNIENVRYALINNKLALVITTRYALIASGSGYNFALLEADSTTNKERFYVEFAPNLTGSAVQSAQGMEPQALTSASAQAPGAQQKVVVIDAGHGDQDPGAVSPYAQEKDVVLAISLKLEAYLKAQGVQVIMTRSDDTFLELEERATFATPNINLFVSVHANAAAESASGIETWVFGQSLEPESLARAIEENGGGAEGKALTQEAQSVAQGVTGDIYRENQLQYSLELANLVQSKMIAATGAKDRGVQQAAFVVIRHARSPAILVETGFVSNPDEGTRLTQNDYQDTMARAIAEGIVQFLNQGSTVATNP
ncbi:MAG: N-acetylmuramoyl-L-alanine amidase family protein [Trueperaceae bacterium]